MKTTARIETLNHALKRTNHFFGNNIKWLVEPKEEGNYLRFSFKLRNKQGLGRDKQSFPCWHVHCRFYDAVFDIEESAEIQTANDTLHKKSDNWKDFRVTKNDKASEFCYCI